MTTQTPSPFGLGPSKETIKRADDMVQETLAAVLSDPDAEPTEETEEPVEKPSEASADKSKEEPKDEPTEPTPPPEDGVTVARVKQMRRYKNQAGEYLAEARKLWGEAQTKAAELERDRGEVAGLRELQRAVESGDVHRAISVLAARTGTDTVDLMRRWVEQQTSGKPQPASAKDADPEIAALKKEIADLKAERENEKKQLTEAEKQQQAQAEFDATVDRMAAIKSEPKWAAKWPNAARLPDAHLKQECGRKLHAALQRMPAHQISLDDIVAEVDKWAGALYGSQQEPGQGTPAQAAPKPRSAQPAQPSTVSNHDTASANAVRGRRRMSQAERNRLADERAAQGAADYVALQGVDESESDDDHTEVRSQF